MNIKSNEWNRLEMALHQTSDKRVYERYLSFLHHMEGQTSREIASMIKRTEKTVSTYLSRYREGGIEALALVHSPGNRIV